MKEIEELKEIQEYIKKYGLHACIRKYGREYNYMPGTSLEGVVCALERFRRNGEKFVFTKFAGVYLYSADETFDSAFRKIYGMSRKSWLEKLARDKRWMEAKKAEEALNNSRKLKLK